MSNYGEPWKYVGTLYPYSTPQGRPIQSFCLSVQHAKGDWEAIFCRTEEQARRIESCVNACAGFADPQEMQRLAVAMKICLGSLCVQYDPRKSQGLYLSGPHGGLPDLQLQQFTVEEILRAARELKLPEIEMLEEK